MLVHNVHEVLIVDYVRHFCDIGMINDSYRFHLALVDGFSDFCALRALVQLRLVDFFGAVSDPCFFVSHLEYLIQSAILFKSWFDASDYFVNFRKLHSFPSNDCDPFFDWFMRSLGKKGI